MAESTINISANTNPSETSVVSNACVEPTSENSHGYPLGMPWVIPITQKATQPNYPSLKKQPNPLPIFRKATQPNYSLIRVIPAGNLTKHGYYPKSNYG